jgi:hypothetical protein
MPNGSEVKVQKVDANQDDRVELVCLPYRDGVQKIDADAFRTWFGADR